MNTTKTTTTNAAREAGRFSIGQLVYVDDDFLGEITAGPIQITGKVGFQYTVEVEKETAHVSIEICENRLTAFPTETISGEFHVTDSGTEFVPKGRHCAAPSWRSRTKTTSFSPAYPG